MLQSRERTHESDEESKDINDAQSEGRLLHGTPAIEAVVEVASARGDASIEVAAVRTGDSPHNNHASDESSHDEEIDEGDKEAIVPGAEVHDQSEEDPGQCYARDDEEY